MFRADVLLAVLMSIFPLLFQAQEYKPVPTVPNYSTWDSSPIATEKIDIDTIVSGRVYIGDARNSIWLISLNGHERAIIYFTTRAKPYSFFKYNDHWLYCEDRCRAGESFFEDVKNPFILRRLYDALWNYMAAP